MNNLPRKVILGEYNKQRAEEWFHTPYFCPLCGTKNLWNAPAEDDYYEGSPFACTSCGCRFHTKDLDIEKPVKEHKGDLDRYPIPGLLSDKTYYVM